MSYDDNFAKWEKGSYTVGDRRTMLTKWVGQAWRELHAEKGELIRQTFRKLGLSLAVDGSEDAEISIRDLPGMEVGDWRLPSDQIDEQQVDDPDEIDEATVNAGNEASDKFVEVEYGLNDEKGVENGEQDEERNSDSELEDDRSEGEDDRSEGEDDSLYS